MKHITTKKTIVALTITSCLIAAPVLAQTATHKKEKSTVQTEQVIQIGTTQSSPTSDSHNNDETLKTGVIISSSKIEYKDNTESAINGEEINNTEKLEDEKGENKGVKTNFNICIGHCEDDTGDDTVADSDEENDDDEAVSFRFNNRRDGLQFDVSAISSVGDNYGLTESDSSDSEFDIAISYRMQLLGLFIESPGVSTRRIQGMYSMPAWGLNFYNSEDWSFDLFYQYSTRGIEGLEGIQLRNKDKRAGLRMTGFFENSQFQAIYSPVSRNDVGSDGIEASISYSHNWQFRNWNYYTNVGMQYRSQEVTPYNYEGYGSVSTTDDNLSFSDGINYSAEIGFEYPLTTDWVFGGFVGYNALSERSTVIRQDNVKDGYRAGALITYVF